MQRFDLSNVACRPAFKRFLGIQLHTTSPAVTSPHACSLAAADPIGPDIQKKEYA